MQSGNLIRKGEESPVRSVWSSSLWKQRAAVEQVLLWPGLIPGGRTSKLCSPSLPTWTVNDMCAQRIIQVLRWEKVSKIIKSMSLCCRSSLQTGHLSCETLFCLQPVIRTDCRLGMTAKSWESVGVLRDCAFLKSCLYSPSKRQIVQ